MKKIKLKPGMPMSVKYITRDSGDKSEYSHAWAHKPQYEGESIGWRERISGGFLCEVILDERLKPGEIAKVVK